MSLTLDVQLTFTPVTCFSCGVIFGVPEELNARNLRLKSETSFWCPNGHEQHYIGKSHAQQLAEAKQTASVAEARARELRAQLEQEQTRLARLKKRVKAGVCPCCQRTFTCLARHLKTKHPEYAK